MSLTRPVKLFATDIHLKQKQGTTPFYSLSHTFELWNCSQKPGTQCLIERNGLKKKMLMLGTTEIQTANVNFI